MRRTRRGAIFRRAVTDTDFTFDHGALFAVLGADGDIVIAVAMTMTTTAAAMHDHLAARGVIGSVELAVVIAIEFAEGPFRFGLRLGAGDETVGVRVDAADPLHAMFNTNLMPFPAFLGMGVGADRHGGDGRARQQQNSLHGVSSFFIWTTRLPGHPSASPDLYGRVRLHHCGDLRPGCFTAETWLQRL